MAENLSIWKAVEETDPSAAKAFNRGGFKGTAVDPMYLAERATEMFGPAGRGWGFEKIEEQFIDGAPLVSLKTGDVLGRTVIHVVYVRLWYCLDGEEYSIYHFGQTTFCGQRNNGAMFTDEEAPKKSLTDAMSKCLSLLGFSADIHRGRFDDNKYVNDVAQKFQQKKKENGVAVPLEWMKVEDTFRKRMGVKRVADADLVVSWLTGGEVQKSKQVKESAERTKRILDELDNFVLVYPSVPLTVILAAARSGAARDGDEFVKLIASVKNDIDSGKVSK